MTLKKYESVVTAWAEPASGPGWANSPVCVLIYDQIRGSHRVEWLQPDELTHDMHTLYRVSAAVSGQMRQAAEMKIGRERKGV